MLGKKNDADHLFFKDLEMQAQNLIFKLPAPDSNYWDQLRQHGRFHFQGWEIEAIIHHLSRLTQACNDAANYHKPN